MAEDMLSLLGDDALYGILTHLPPESISILACTCKRLAGAIQGNQALWQAICCRKWGHCSPSAQSKDWAAAYATGNGWEDPAFSATRLAPTSDFVSALLPLHEAGSLLLATSTGLQLRMARMGPTSEDSEGGSSIATRDSTLLAECQVLPEHAIVHALDLVGGGGSVATVVGGLSTGALEMWRLDGNSLRHVGGSAMEGGSGPPVAHGYWP